MGNSGQMLSPQNAEEIAEKGAYELEKVIDQFNDRPEMDTSRHEELVSCFMSLLAEAHRISPVTSCADSE